MQCSQLNCKTGNPVHLCLSAPPAHLRRCAGDDARRGGELDRLRGEEDRLRDLLERLRDLLDPLDRRELPEALLEDPLLRLQYQGMAAWR